MEFVVFSCEQKLVCGIIFVQLESTKFRQTKSDFQTGICCLNFSMILNPFNTESVGWTLPYIVLDRTKGVCMGDRFNFLNIMTKFSLCLNCSLFWWEFLYDF